MSLDEHITEALEPIGIEVAHGTYDGPDTEYFSFNYDFIPIFADDRPLFYRALIQVHLFCPLKYNSVQIRTRTVTALLKAGVTYPEIMDASDEDSQHYVFETEAAIAAKEVEE